uniref:Ribosome-binding factor A n=1 Tax=Candidatus Caldatribacterium californiense TaxID=1454726 RepID=A0A7V4DGT2_9BACT
MKEQRPLRVAELIKREVSRILLSEVEDPRLRGFTITRVEMSPDLKQAKIFVGFLGEAEEGERYEALKRATKFIRGVLASRIRIKFMPEIVFVADPTLEKAFQVVELLNRLEQENQ